MPALEGIREWIFTNGTGNVTELLGSDGDYGLYRVLGNLSVTIPSLQFTNASILNYTRMLDLTDAIHTTRFSTSEIDLETSVFCSFPDQVCVYVLQASRQLPELQIRLDNELVAPELQNRTCGPDHVRLRGVTQLGPPVGMQYDAIARVASDSGCKTWCLKSTTALTITPGNGTRAVAIVIGAGTNYDAKKGTSDFGYSFRGEDSGPAVEEVTRKAASKSLIELKFSHVEDYNSLMGRFELVLPDSLNSSQVPTSELIARYDTNNLTGDPYLENLFFDYATYMFVASFRPGSDRVD